jgi:hypothetical protein
MRLFSKKSKKINFWSIFANFSHILRSKNHVLKKVSKHFFQFFFDLVTIISSN